MSYPPHPRSARPTTPTESPEQPGSSSTPATENSSAPTTTPTKLEDQFGRTADDLRISLIDKCNLRCTYCMPSDGLPWMPQSQLLTTDEAIRIADIAIRHFGIKDIRFTGGEPLIRTDLEHIIAGVRARHSSVSLAITTNALGLDTRAQALKDAGLTRINVSLDTVDPDTFAQVTRRKKLADVISGIEAARQVGLKPLKINAVAMRGINDDAAPDLLAWCLERGLQLRFIEQMPLDADRAWIRENLVSAAEIRERLSERFMLSPSKEPRGSAPAELWDVVEKESAGTAGSGTTDRALVGGSHTRSPGAPLRGQVGIIASVTESFCQDCSRTRVTADGKVRSCLFSHEETDLLHAMRSRASDEEIARLWSEAMWSKPRAHGSNTVRLSDPMYIQPKRSMSAIGG